MSKKNPDELVRENPVKKMIPPRSHIPCPNCSKLDEEPPVVVPMSWESKPEVEKRGGFPVATGIFWGKIWCRCGLVQEANPWPSVAVPLKAPLEAVRTSPGYLKKYRSSAGHGRGKKLNLK